MRGEEVVEAVVVAAAACVVVVVAVAAVGAAAADVVVVAGAGAAVAVVGNSGEIAIADLGVYRAEGYAGDLVGEDVAAWASEDPSYRRRPSWMSVIVD